MSRSRRTAGGFTIAELITVCAIIAVLAATTLPVAQFVKASAMVEYVKP